MTFSNNDEVKVYNGTNYWPEGNNYGIADHGGTKIVYFRPNGDGGDDWHYHVIYMVDSE